MGESPAKAEGPSPDHDNDQERGRDACDRDGGGEADGLVSGRPEVTIELPVPLSANRIWRVAGTRLTKAGKRVPRIIKNPEYVAWQNEAGWMLRAQRPGRVTGAYELTVTVPRVGIDLDNAIKATSDLLVTHSIVEDDKLARRIAMGVDDTAELMVVTVRAAA